MDSDLAQAAAYLRGRANELHRIADEYDTHGQNPEGAASLRSEAAEADATADLLDAIQTPAERLADRGVPLRPDVYPIDRAIVAAQALAAAILDTQETTNG